MGWNENIDTLLFSLFGMSGWFVGNALYAEMPIFTSCAQQATALTCTYTLPEGPQISSYINVMTQLGNIVPLMYRIFSSRCGTRATRLPIAILLSLLVGVAGALVGALYWDDSMFLLGADRSILLLVCALGAGTLGSMSSIVWWQFAAVFPEECTRSVSIGMALGGLFPTTIALAQNVGTNGQYRFQPKAMLLLAAAVQVLFVLVFFIIWRRAIPILEEQSKKEQEQRRKELEEPLMIEEQEQASSVDVENGRSSPSRGSESTAVTNMDNVVASPESEVLKLSREEVARQTAQTQSSKPGMSPVLQQSVVLTMFSLYFAVYSLPSFVPYILRDYANYSELYTLVTFSYTAGDVLGRSITGVKTCGLNAPSWSTLFVLTIIVFGLYALQILCAIFHTEVTTHILPGHLGYVFMIIQFMFYFVRGYVVTSFFVLIKQQCAQRDAEVLSGRLGTMGQVGSALGTLVAFLIISVAQVFG